MNDPTTELTERDRQILDFEAGPHWNYQGAKEDEIRRRFDISATRYHQVLNALIERDQALAYKPVLVKRLRRLRDERQRHRKQRAMS